MMVTIFTSLSLALLAAHRGPRWLGLAALALGLALAMGEFVYEIDSPVDGFRLPWLQAGAQTMIHAGKPA